MKKKTFGKKLGLVKNTIAHLDQADLSKAVGGATAASCPGDEGTCQGSVCPSVCYTCWYTGCQPSCQ